LAPERASTTK
jgi:hypothetical protein